MTTRNRELAGIIDDSGNITAGGNLTVSGTTLTSSSTVETHADPLIELNTGAGSNSNDLGFVFERGSTGDNACIIWDESNDGFAVGTTTATGTSTGNMTFTAADFAAGKVTVDNILINGTTIGHTSDTDLLTFADGVLTVAGEVSMTTLDIGGTNVTSTAAELNILDGVTSTAAELNILDGVTATAAEINFLDGDTSATGTTLASADRVIVNDGGTMKQVALSDFETFFESEIDTFSTIDINGGTIDGATVGANSASTGAFTTLSASGAITGTLGTAAQSNITSLGTLTTLTVDDITIDGSTISDSGDLTIDVGGDINFDADDGVFRFRDGGTNLLSMYDSSGFTLQTNTNNGNLYFKGVDDTSIITALTLNMSDAGKATFNAGATWANRTEINYNGDYQFKIDNTVHEPWYQRVQSDGTFAIHLNGTGNILHATSSGIGVTGEVTATSLDISGNVDIDGVLETDNLTVGGAQGSDGQVLTSTGSGVGWEDAGGTTINSNTNNYVITGTGTSNTLQGESGLLFSDGRNLGLGVTPEANWANDDNAVQVGGLGAVWGKTTAAAAKHTTLSNNVYDHPSTGQAAIVTDEGAKITLTNGTILLATTPAATTADAAHSWNAGINIAADGIVGIDVVPETDWHSDWKALQVGAGTLSTLTTGAQTSFAQNARGTTGSSNGGWKYIESQAASQYVQDAGNHYFKYAASGSADGTITWTQAMNIGANGKVGIGTASPESILHIEKALSSDTQSTPETILTLSAKYTSTGADGAAGTGPRLLFEIPDDNTNPRPGAAIDAVKENGDDGISDTALVFSTSQNDSTLDEAMRIDKDGKVGIGTATPGTNHSKANNLVVGSGSAGGMSVYNGTAEGWYAFSRDNANNTDAYDGGMSYDGSRNLKFHTNAGATRMTIDGSGYVTKPAQPVFDAGRNAGYQTDDAYFIQDYSRVNVGSHYNTSTGKFTAPIAGTYFFTFSIMTHDSGSTVQAVVQLRKNGSAAMNFLQHKTGAYHTRVTGNMILTLAANDYVQTYVGDSGTSSGWQGSAHEYNVFGGFLIG